MIVDQCLVPSVAIVSKLAKCRFNQRKEDQFIVGLATKLGINHLALAETDNATNVRSRSKRLKMSRYNE